MLQLSVSASHPPFNLKEALRAIWIAEIYESLIGLASELVSCPSNPGGPESLLA